MGYRRSNSAIGMMTSLALLSSCGPAEPPASTTEAGARFRMVGKLEADKLDEASGIQAGANDVFFLHNDDGSELFAINPSGKHLGRMKIDNARNKDWEDITRVPGADSALLVIGDIGDNHGGRKKVRLYFVEEPGDGDFDRKLKPVHRLDVRYEDGPRDVESLAYDSTSDMILFLSKRDQPPRLYGIPLDLALVEDELEAAFLAEVPGLRPPTRKDILTHPKRGLWVSQPTGMDISADGRRAAVITYRSLYLFERMEDETWAEAFGRPPTEYTGPPGLHDEAVSFGHDPTSIYVTTERRPAPLYRLDIP